MLESPPDTLQWPLPKRYSEPMTRLILAFLAFLAAAAQPATAQPSGGECTSESGEKGVALLIGVSAYDGTPGTVGGVDAEGWSPLPNAARDIALVCRSLAQAGYAMQVVQDPDWATLDSAIADFHLAASQAPSALVYFAGHGFQFQGMQYLVPADAPAISATDAMRSHFIPIDRLLDAASAAEQFSLFLMDACRTSFPHVHIVEEETGDSQAAAQTIGLFDVPGGAVIFSTAAGRPAYDDAPVGSSESPFAAAVARNLAVPGLRLMDFYTNLHLDVVEMTEEMQPAGPQHPALYSTRPANFYLVEALDEETLAQQAESAGTAPELAFPPMAEIAVTDGRILVGQVLGDISLASILAAADAGDSTAQYVAGLAYQHGVGVEEDAEAAIAWFEMSATQGNPAGQTSLAYMLTSDEFADRPRALALFRTASAQGYAKAKSQLGYYLLSGELGEEDREEAVALFREASQAGHVFATYALGQYGEGERANAEARLAELAAAGNPEGDNWLCEMRYIELDFARMAGPCERAALAGYAAPRAIWAGMLARGDGVERDNEQAQYWARLALTQLDPARRQALHDYTQGLIR